MSLPWAAGVGAGVGGGTTGRAVAVGCGRTGCAIAVGSAAGSDTAGAAVGSAIASSLATGPALDSGAAAVGAPAALVSRVLRRTPPIRPKRIKTLIVDPTRTIARFVMAFPSYVRLVDYMGGTITA